MELKKGVVRCAEKLFRLYTGIVYHETSETESYDDEGCQTAPAALIFAVFYRFLTA